MALAFGDLELDLDAHELRRAGTLVHLVPKAYALLELLVRKRPRAVSREEIQAAVWGGVFVTDGSIAVGVAAVRRALGDDGVEQRFVRTIRGFGYAFCFPLVENAATAHGDPSPCDAICRLVVWGVEQRRLPAGSYLIGRGAECGVQIDAGSLSRRHARLTLADREATLEDLGSKNGSFVDGVRVGGVSVPAAVPVREGDEIRLGSVVLSLHWLSAGAPTETLAGSSGRDGR